MNKLILLFAALLCLVAVNARHFDRNDESIENEEETLRRPKEHNTPPRHRRRRWQSYGYDYSPPSYHYPDRRDYERNNQEAVLQHISKLLEEISTYLRRPPPPPPPPQPIYIPYPMVYYPQSPRVTCKPQTQNNQNKTGEKVPAVPNRTDFNEMDPNRNWGLVASAENDYDYADGARPISFEPIAPKQFMKRPAPSVEHGSEQASFQARQPETTKAPIFDDPPSLSVAAPMPGMCNAAILTCCSPNNDKAQQKQCFSNIGCSNAFDSGSACSKESINRALESFQVAYSPMN